MRVRLVVLGAALAAAGCSDREPAATPQAAPAPVVATAPAVTAPVPAPPPAGAEPVDLALKAAQDFNAAAEAELAAIAEIEARFAPAARRALAAARTGDGRTAKRPLDEANTAYKALADRLAAFQTNSTALTAQVKAASDACAATPEMAAYAGCVALAAEQATLTASIDGITSRFAAAEAAWRQARPGLDEAAAAVALGG